MSQAEDPSDIAQRIYAILNDDTARVELFGTHGTVLYGDQEKLPTTPTVCVEAGTTQRPLAAAVKPGGMVENRHECFILIYHSKVQDIEDNKLESELLARATMKYLDERLRLQTTADPDGIVVHGWCTSIDPGYAVKQGTLFKAVRIQWNGISKTRLGA